MIYDKVWPQIVSQEHDRDGKKGNLQYNSLSVKAI